MRYHIYRDGEWIRPARLAYVRCCRCGLVHRTEYRVKDGRPEFRVWRLPMKKAR